MIALLDTNIILAALTDGESTPQLDGFDDIVVSSITYSEMSFGLGIQTDLGRYRSRNEVLRRAKSCFGDGIPYDDECADAMERIMAKVVQKGGSARAHVLDRMIAATALARDLTLVTRDIGDHGLLSGLVRVEQR